MIFFLLALIALCVAQNNADKPSMGEAVDFAKFVNSFMESVKQADMEQQQQIQQANQQRIESMGAIVVAIERAIARGSAFYNAGQADQCRQLYFQTAQSIFSVLQDLGEMNAARAVYEGTTLAVAEQDVRRGAWQLRAVLEDLVRAVRNSESYAALFEQGEWAEQVESVREQPEAECARGLSIKQDANGDLVISEVRAGKGCDEQLESSDAVFFVQQRVQSANQPKSSTIRVQPKAAGGHRNGGHPKGGANGQRQQKGRQSSHRSKQQQEQLEQEQFIAFLIKFSFLFLLVTAVAMQLARIRRRRAMLRRRALCQKVTVQPLIAPPSTPQTNHIFMV